MSLSALPFPSQAVSSGFKRGDASFSEGEPCAPKPLAEMQHDRAPASPPPCLRLPFTSVELRGTVERSGVSSLSGEALRLLCCVRATVVAQLFGGGVRATVVAQLIGGDVAAEERPRRVGACRARFEHNPNEAVGA